ncbi:hypothetical protein [Aeromicrobium choanae]|uniref:Uncharacterized protein n=1 Tax=Aeromicrobium choanae TaxID=1736691 RepID=A0A1T4Z2U1_9ACTN|nr:hypothetical protein [Aeromicrobium choanae]SKB08369.1 hypothetical protein SAMN06295964_2133 [Aeromicrobium choanae]
MHIVSRTFAVLATAAALTLSALPPTQAGERATVEDRLGRIALVEDAVPLAESPTGAVKRGRVPIETAGGASLALQLPAAGPATRVDGRYHLSAAGGASLAVAPTATGTQVLIGIDSAAAPATYDFGLRGDVSPRPAPDGGIDLVGPDGAVVAQVERPWAVDAEGRHVPTRYELRGSTVRQVVDHRTRDVAYPVVADPKIFACDAYTSLCVKFSKKETKSVAAKFKKANASARALAAFICAKIPHPLIAIGCAATVLAALPSLRKTFLSASSKGQCVELHFRVPSGLLWKWKKEKC